MKTKRNLLGLLMLATLSLAACGGNDNSVNNEGNGSTPTNSETTSNNGGTVSTPASSDTNSEVGGGNDQVGAVLASATFEGTNKNTSALPASAAGWVYYTNNDSFPDPNFNTDGYKFDWVNEGMESPAFASQSKVTFNMTVDTFNAKKDKQTDTGAAVFTVKALDASNAVIDTEVIQTPVTGVNSVTLEAAGIVKVQVFMTNYHSDSSASYNIKVTLFEVKKA